MLKKDSVYGIDKYEDKYFEKHYYIFKYNDKIRNLILDFKFNEKPYLYKSFSKFLNKFQKNDIQNEIYDIIIPVPISKKRKKERGYNQSLLIAKETSQIHKIKLEKNAIKKVKNNMPQSSLNKIDREQNTQDMYKILDNKKVIDKNILLIDDIFTTGSTVNECSKTLKQAGARKIDVLTIAKD